MVGFDESLKLAGYTTSSKRSLAVMGAIDELLQRAVPRTPELGPKRARLPDDVPPLVTVQYSAEKALTAVTTQAPNAVETSLVSREEEEEENRAASPSSIMMAQEAAPVVPSNQKRTAEERFIDAQAEARRRGKDASLKWSYSGDELTGATCGEATFSRDELLQLSSCWAGK